MKSIKLIELLNKIANNEEVPKQVSYRDDVYMRQGQRYLTRNGKELFDCYNPFSKDVLNYELEIYEPCGIEIAEGVAGDVIKIDGTVFYDVPQELMEEIKKLMEENKMLKED